MSAAGGPNLTPVQVTVNGQPAGALALSPFDRGLHFGDGVFETIACRNGRPRFLSLHLERLLASCQRLQIQLGEIETVRNELRALAATAGDSLIKLIVTRGDAVARGYGWSGTESATRLAFRYAWPAENGAAARDGIRVRFASLRYGENERLAGMKHLNRLEQVLARSEVAAEEADELLVFSRSGHLVSGTMSNVFLVHGGVLRTPLLDKCGVAGVMRRVVMREAVKAGIPVEESDLNAGHIEGASEIFMTNARIGIWPVRALDERRLEPGLMTRRLQERLAPMLEHAVDA